MDHYDEEAFVRDARRCAGLHPKGLQFAMLKDRPIGMLQLDTAFPEPGVGHIPFVYLRDEVRGQRLGNQLIGEAASVFGKLGKSFLRLRVSESNVRAQRFYGKLGFFQVDVEEAPAGRLFILKKSIQKII